MNLFVKAIRFFWDAWITGVLYILMVFGYIFYFLLRFLRMIQMKFLKSLAIFTLVLTVAILGFLYWGFYAPEEKIGEPIEFRIERGTSLTSIGNQLEEAGIVPSGKLFYYYMRGTELSASVQAGLFEIPANAGIIRVSELLDSPIPEGTPVQVVEGLTIWQTASTIASQYDIDSTQFIALCNDTSFIRSLGFETESTLEGYLFPETYTIPLESNERTIISIMTQQFLKAFEALPSSGKGSEMDRLSLVTLASVVEKEAKVPDERARISAVFHNRLDQKIPLGADPTIRYAIRKFSGPLRVSELRNRSPYNTRIHTGLMPGPICSPGKAALVATVQPIETNELFFVAKWDGSGEHYFSVTNAEHNRRKHQVRRENRELSNW